MKKLVSLLLAVVMVMGLATVAFAEDAPVSGSSADAPIEVAEIPGTVEVKAGSIVWYSFPMDMEGYTISITSASRAVIMEHSPYGDYEAWGAIVESEVVEGVEIFTVSYTLQAPMGMYPGMTAGIVLGIGSVASEDITYTVDVQVPAVGSYYNPLDIKLGEEYSVTTLEDDWFNYTAEFTAEKGGYLVLTVKDMTGGSDYASVSVNGMTGGYQSVDKGAAENTIEIAVVADETVSVQINGGGENMTATFVCSFHEAEAGEIANPIIIEDAAKEYSFTVEAGKYYTVSDVYGASITVSGADAVVNGWIDINFDDSEEENAVVIESYQETYTLCVTGEKESYTVTISEPLGFDENPEVLESLENVEVEIYGYGEDDYNYLWVATADGKLTLALSNVAWGTDEADWVGDAIAECDLIAYVNDTAYVGVDGVVTLDVAAGDKIRINVAGVAIEGEYAARNMTAVLNGTLAILGSQENPFEISDPSQLGSVSAAAGSETYYQISSMLNGMILNVAAQDGITVTVNGVAVEAVNGLFSVELTGAPSNRVVIANAGNAAAELIASIEYALGTENNPIVINTTAQLSKVDVAAGGQVYLAVNGQLNGNYLTIKGENITVTANGEAVTAKNGLFVVELNKAPMNQIIIANTGDAAASYDAAIMESIPATGDNTMMALPMVLALVSVMALAVALVSKKKAA